MKRTTHSYFSSESNGHTSTLYAVCGYFETFDLGVQKQHDTGFIVDGEISCEDCNSILAMNMLARLP